MKRQANLARHTLFLALVLLSLGLFTSVAMAATQPSLIDDFNTNQIDTSQWVVDEDSGYTVGAVGGTFRVYSAKAKGSGGPSDSIASKNGAAVWKVDINPVTLHAGANDDESQMGAIYIAQNASRGGPLVAYGFIADQKQDGSVDLVYRMSGGPNTNWIHLAEDLPSNRWHTLQAVYRADGRQVDLYFDGFKVKTVEGSFGADGPHVVLRTGGWSGLVAKEIEVLYDNVSSMDAAPAFAAE